MADNHGPRQYLPEKAGEAYDIREKSEKPTSPSPDNISLRKMPSARSFIFALLVLFSVAFGLGSATVPSPKRQAGEGEQSSSGEEQAVLGPEDSTFTKLLSSASPDALHQLLHTYFPKTFRHGVYPSDESAVEAVRSSDADLANVLLSLARRQDNGSSTSATITTSTTSQGITISTTTTVPSSPTSTTIQQQTSTQASSATTSAPGGTTTVQSQTNPTGTTTTTPPVTTTKVQTTSVANSATNGVSSNHGTTLSTTTSPGKSESSTIESLFTSSRTATFTSTLPGGAKTTITSVEIVTGGIPVSGSTTSAVAGSLQTGAAVLNYRMPMVEAVVGLAIGGALLA